MASFLDVANEVLLLVGEREVASFSTPVGRKARLALLRAINVCHMLGSWRFLRQTTQTSSLEQWSGGTATIVPFVSILGVSYQQTVNSVTRINLRSANPRTIRECGLELQSQGIPTNYAITADNKVTLYPEPLATIKPTVMFDIVATPTLPNLPTDEFAFPYYFEALCKLYAESVMHTTHTTDSAAADATMRQFELMLQTTRTQFSLMSISNMSQ